jgi:hypothetical protein
MVALFAVISVLVLASMMLAACGGTAAPAQSSAPAAPLISSTALPQGDFKVDVFLFGYEGTTIPADGDVSFDTQMTGFSTVGSKFQIIASNGDKFYLETSKTLPETGKKLNINVKNFFGMALTNGDEPYVMYNGEKYSLVYTEGGFESGHVVMHFNLSK